MRRSPGCCGLALQVAPVPNHVALLMFSPRSRTSRAAAAPCRSRWPQMIDDFDAIRDGRPGPRLPSRAAAQCSAPNPSLIRHIVISVSRATSPLPLRRHGNRRRVARHGPWGAARPGNTWTPGCSRSVIRSCRRNLGRSGQIEHWDLLDDRVLLSNSQHDQVVGHRELSIVECRMGSNGVHPGRPLLRAQRDCPLTATTGSPQGSRQMTVRW